MEDELGLGFWLAVISLLLFTASTIVSIVQSPNEGEEWGECYPNQTCLEELVCHRERCVAPMGVE